MFPYRLSRNRHENQRQKPVWCSMVKRSADLRVLTALILLAWPAMAPAQSLPGHFQYSEVRHYDDGRTCTIKLDVQVRGSNVLMAPLSQDCDGDVDSFAGDEGAIFPLDRPERGPRKCTIAVGQNPIMTCSDGETKALLNFAADEPLRVDGVLARSATWAGGVLTLDLDNSETRYTLAGGSGRKPQKVRFQFHLEFTFEGNRCTPRTVSRVRTQNNRHDHMTNITTANCRVLG